MCVCVCPGETGLVGTTMYMAPELFKSLKYTQVREWKGQGTEV